jgi:hypothetical protein
LAAEDARKVNPNLVARDRYGKSLHRTLAVVNAMLLNEFLKEHRIATTTSSSKCEPMKGWLRLWTGSGDVGWRQIGLTSCRDFAHT